MSNSPLPTMIVILAVAAAVALINIVLRWLLSHTNIGARNYSKMNPEDLVPIAHFADRDQAQHAHNKLNGRGIKCLIVEEQRSMYRGGIGFRLSPHIEVRAGDADRALGILSEKD